MIRETGTQKSGVVSDAISIEDVDENSVHDTVRRPLTPEEIAIAKQNRELLSAALSQLSDNERDVFYFRRAGDMRIKEIAEMMKLTEDNVDYCLKVATNKLRGLLEKQ